MTKMPQVIPHSGGLKQLKHNATRTSKLSPTSAMVTPHSGSRSDVMGNDGIGNPRAKASDRTEQAIGKVPTITPHSEVAVPRAPKKWNKQKFAMGVPTKLTK